MSEANEAIGYARRLLHYARDVKDPRSLLDSIGEQLLTIFIQSKQPLDFNGFPFLRGLVEAARTHHPEMLHKPNCACLILQPNCQKGVSG